MAKSDVQQRLRDRPIQHDLLDRSGPPRRYVGEIQRRRLMAAMAEVATAHGAGAVTVSRVVTRAGLSRRTFYEQFQDREECFVATFDHAVGLATGPVLAAYESQTSWRGKVRAGLAALLIFFDREPILARFCVIEALAAGPQIMRQRAKVLLQLIAVVEEGCGRGLDSTNEPLPMTADGVVGAVLSVIHTHLLEDRSDPLIDLQGVLMGIILTPYQGKSAARRELHRPVPSASGDQLHASAEPLEDLNMRITYRTVRVLRVIATSPGANNRTIANAAGISDQGQISKLLSRLQGRGLVHNQEAVSVRGAPNAWALTEKGHQVEQAVRLRAAE